MKTDLYDCPVIAFPRLEKKIALIMGGKFQTLKELWSGRAGREGSGAKNLKLLPTTYLPDPTDKHLHFPG